MTPGERAFDIDLVKAGRNAAKRIRDRSKSISTTIVQLCDRLQTLSANTPIDEPKPEQPASQPVAPQAQPGD